LVCSCGRIHRIVIRLERPGPEQLEVEATQTLPRTVINLTPLERKALFLVARGHTDKEIARALNYRIGQIKRAIRGVLLRLGAHNRAEAAARAVSLGLLSESD
jgi:DNA-binding CsgD family transcriptional regulator